VYLLGAAADSGGNGQSLTQISTTHPECSEPAAIKDPQQFLRFFPASVHPTPIRKLQRMSELRAGTPDWKYDRSERELR
jgi:hypothetical protein